MKQFFTFLAAVVLTATTYAQVGIGTTTPHASAALDITSTTKGFLTPRMTNVQRQSISNPAAGLMVFVTDFDGGRFMFYDGTEWGTISFTEKRPDAPTIGTAVAADAQATVSFTAPSSDGGSAITSYTATSNPGGITGTLSQAGSGDIIVSGLTNGTAYTFTVTATNAIGTSLASAVSNSVAPATIPDAPAITGVASGDAQATVSFTAPSSDGGSAITSYTATSSPGDITATVSQAGSGDITVTGLTNDTSYTFTVTATNAIGTSIASAASSSVTPSTPTPTVFSPTTGRTWMDRNLGATQVASSSTDAASYGDLYQWGRNSDGHQIRTSSIADGPVASGSEGSNFITNSSDWLSTQDNTRWNGSTKGTEDPCPSGFRVPTHDEWEDELTNFSTANAAGAYNSPLKLPVAGARGSSNGALLDVGSYGLYWSSTVSGTNARLLSFGSSNALVDINPRALGFSVRCIKE